MRLTGTDKFDDFEMMMLVHDIQCTTSKHKLTTLVRVTAGLQVVETDESSKGIFQQPLSIFVEQGTDVVNIELLNYRDRKVLAGLKMDILKDILERKEGRHEQVMPMKQKNKGVLNPRIKLSIILESQNEAEKGLLSGIDLGQEANMMVMSQLRKVVTEADKAGEQLSELDLLCKGCQGPLDMFGSWRSQDQVFVAVMFPPESKRYILGIWKDKADYERGVKANPEIDLLKIISVQQDPGRSEVFVMNYIESGTKAKKRLTFRRLDRARDVWVDMFQLLIKLVHEQKELRKRMKAQPTM